MHRRRPRSPRRQMRLVSIDAYIPSLMVALVPPDSAKASSVWTATCGRSPALLAPVINFNLLLTNTGAGFRSWINPGPPRPETNHLPALP
jgi:hypothetical protein